MATQVQFRRGTTADISTFIGADGEVVVDTTKKTCVVNDGVQIAGYPLLREDGSNSALNVGSLSSCALKFVNDPNTGIISPGADQIALVTGGASRLSVDSSGSVTIPGNLLVAGSVTGSITFDNGSAAVPALRFTNDPDTGIYLAGTNELAISTGGTQRLTTTTTAVTSTLPVVHPLGTAAAPSLTFTGDTNTGIYSPGADQVAISTAGSGRLFVNSAGRVGLGTASSIAPSAPLDDFHIASTDPAVLLEETDAGVDEKYWRIRAEGSILRFEGVNDAFNSTQSWLNVTRTTGARTVDNIAFNTGTNERLRIDSSGRLLVGTSSTPPAVETLTPGFALSSSGSAQDGYTAGIYSYRSAGGSGRQTVGPKLFFGRSRSGTNGSTGTVVVDGENIGDIRFAGDDGSKFVTAAEIRAFVDGTPGADDMPGRLVFSTTADGASSPTERLRITSAGLVGVGTSSPSSLLHIQSTGPVFTGTNTTSQATTIGTAEIFKISPVGQRNGIYGTVGSIIFRQDGATWSSVDAFNKPTRIEFCTQSSDTSDTSETPRLVINRAGNVGIGVTSPLAQTHITSTSAGSGAIALRLENNSATAGTETILQFAPNGSNSTTRGAQISGLLESTNGTNLLFYTNPNTASPLERLRIDSSGRLLVGTSTARSNFYNGANTAQIQLEGTNFQNAAFAIVCNANSDDKGSLILAKNRGTTVGSNTIVQNGDDLGSIEFQGSDGAEFVQAAAIKAEVDGTPGANDMPGRLVFSTTADGASSPTRRMSIKQDGSLVFGDFDAATSTASGGKAYIDSSSTLYVAVGGGTVAYFNRNTDDGEIVALRQNNVTEGSISVSGTTVTYGGGHLARWSQLPNDEDPSFILKGTVMSNLDEMCEWGDEDNEQLNKTKVSDVEGDPNVAGVFVSTSFSDDGPLDFFVGMTGDMVIRIAGGVTVERGDLLMSAGDGTAKPQDDDIIRSKTIAKVTSTNVSCTYDDGSYCVPCVLMAC